MPPRDPSLPEGTDKIIDTNAIDTGGSSTGGGGGGASGKPGGTTSGTAGGNTTGTTAATTGGGDTGSAFTFEKSGGGTGKAADTIVNQLKDQVSTLKSTGVDRARTVADDGKRQATDFLTTIAEIIQDAAGSVEERLGSQYSGFGNRAADSVTSLANTLNDRSVDDLFDDARAFVRKSPAVAIGIAAVVGFAVARVVRSSIEEARSSGSTDTTGTGTTSGTGGA